MQLLYFTQLPFLPTPFSVIFDYKFASILTMRMKIQ